MANVVFSIGEALIDFIPKQRGVSLKEVIEFERVPGGAPANVASAVAKLGGESYLISKLGLDAFGDAIIDALNEVGVNTDNVLRTREANTALAFVSLKEDGERDFSFYRNPSADMLLTEDEVDNIEFKEGDILHFCSVDLIDAPVKKAHVRAIDKILSCNGLISFDPNVRLPLWESKEMCRNTIRKFIPYAHILKISDDELEFITGIENEKEAIKSLFVGNVIGIIYTLGAKGSKFITKELEVYAEGFKVNVQDTTGAGDAFIGSFLFSLQQRNITRESLLKLKSEEIKEMLTFSNACAALTTTKKGAIAALPTFEEVQSLLRIEK
jgi:fructokinase